MTKLENLQMELAEIDDALMSGCYLADKAIEAKYSLMAQIADLEAKEFTL